MKTEILRIDPLHIDGEALAHAALILRRGGLVAFPTETVYGLGADADNETAVKSIFAAKGRPNDNPLIIHVPDIALCESYVERIDSEAKRLMEKFWGGPLTIIMKRSKRAKDCVTAGLSTVAIRLPSHSVAHALIKEAKTGIAAPSANLSGKPSPTIAEHVIVDFNGKIDCIVDSGASQYGLESTVIDLSVRPPRILRPGAVSLDMIREILPDACYGGGGDGVPKSPGMKYKHYAPKAPVIVVSGEMEEEAKKHTGRICILDYDDQTYKGDVFLSCGQDDVDYGARLFYLLRMADQQGADVILARNPKGGAPITDALKNRLYKSAGGVIV